MSKKEKKKQREITDTKQEIRSSFAIKLHPELDVYVRNESKILKFRHHTMAWTIQIYSPFPTNDPLLDRQIHQTTRLTTISHSEFYYLDLQFISLHKKLECDFIVV